MRVIEPKPMTLISSNVPDDPAPVWDEDVTYSKDDVVKVENQSPNNIVKKYQSLEDNNQGNYPPEHPDKWLYLGPTNKYAILDERLGTQSVYDNLTFTIRAKKVDAIALLNIEGVSVTITVTRADDGSTIYGPEEFSLRRTYTTGWFSYFYDEYYQETTLLVDNLLVDVPPDLGDMDIEVAFSGEPAKCGLAFVGRSFFIGETMWDARVSIRDYSVKQVDEFGYAYLVKRAYSKQIEVDVILPTQNVSVVQRKLAELRATPCVWDANNPDTKHEALIVYGFYDSFEEVLKNATVSYCNLRIEGLI